MAGSITHNQKNDLSQIKDSAQFVDELALVARRFSSQIIPEDYELAGEIGSEFCNVRNLASVASVRGQIKLGNTVALGLWKKKMSELGTELAKTIGHYY